MMKIIQAIVLLLTFPLFSQESEHITTPAGTTYNYLIEKKFIIFVDKHHRNYNIDIFQNESASFIIKLIHDLDKKEKNYVAPIFFLKMAGANLHNYRERKSFIDTVFVKGDATMADLLTINKVLKQKPDHKAVSTALVHISKQLTPDQTLDFLVKIGFANRDLMSSYGKSNHFTFDQKVIDHFIPKIKEGFKTSLKSHGWFGRGPYNRIAGQL